MIYLKMCDLHYISQISFVHKCLADQRSTSHFINLNFFLTLTSCIWLIYLFSRIKVCIKISVISLEFLQKQFWPFQSLRRLLCKWISRSVFRILFPSDFLVWRCILFCIKFERIFSLSISRQFGGKFWNRWTLSYLLAVYLFRLNKKFYIFPRSIYFPCKSPQLFFFFLYTARLF